MAKIISAGRAMVERVANALLYFDGFEFDGSLLENSELENALQRNPRATRAVNNARALIKIINRPLMTKGEARAIGGRARAEALTPARRSEIARKASNTRWRP